MVKRQLYCERNKCIRCGKCSIACERHVHRMKDGRHHVHFSDCMLCKTCVEACPYGTLGIYGKEMSVEEVVAVVIKDREYYETFEGGATLSGGEPMAQAGYAMEPARAFQEAGVHVCMETSGLALWEKYEQIMPYIDMRKGKTKNIGSDRYLEDMHTPEQSDVEQWIDTIIGHGGIRIFRS